MSNTIVSELAMDMVAKYRKITRESADDFLQEWQKRDAKAWEGFIRSAANRAAQDVMRRELARVLNIVAEKNGIERDRK